MVLSQVLLCGIRRRDRPDGRRLATARQVADPNEVVMAPRSGAGLRSAMEAAGIEPASAAAPT
jgi:hypothetical protein